jgi:hypothetical protein
MQRGPRFDGIVPIHKNWGGSGYLRLEGIPAPRIYAAGLRDRDEPFDVVFSASYPENLSAVTPDVLATDAEAGVT